MSQSKPAARRKARRYALQALYQWSVAGGEPEAIEAQFRADNDFSRADTEYFHELIHGIVRQAQVLDARVEPSLDRALAHLDPVELAILRIGAYELGERIDVPYRVVINEGIELAKRFGATDSHRYVNGILDRVAAELRPAETGGAPAPT